MKTHFILVSFLNEVLQEVGSLLEINDIGGINTCKINEFVVLWHYKINDFGVL